HILCFQAQKIPCSFHNGNEQGIIVYSLRTLHHLSIYLPLACVKIEGYERWCFLVIRLSSKISSAFHKPGEQLYFHFQTTSL
ncbi:hypothetical protein, partial [Acinetobacter baumannii]|uniref:hypothetical protein n=1 Tax=Acinetobacter baumannii TaxID=470 RepID=UPI001969B22D